MYPQNSLIFNKAIVDLFNFRLKSTEFSKTCLSQQPKALVRIGKEVSKVDLRTRTWGPNSWALTLNSPSSRSATKSLPGPTSTPLALQSSSHWSTPRQLQVWTLYFLREHYLPMSIQRCFIGTNKWICPSLEKDLDLEFREEILKFFEGRFYCNIVKVLQICQILKFG